MVITLDGDGYAMNLIALISLPNHGLRGGVPQERVLNAALRLLAGAACRCIP